MDWRHLLFLFVILVIGYYLGTKFPGLITKASFGTVTA